MSDTYALVLVGRYPGKDRSVAMALARDFERDDAWALQVISASPIAMLSGLTWEQANTAHGAMVDVESAGCLFEVRSGIEAGMSQIQWPDEPRVCGRLLSELFAEAESQAQAAAEEAQAVEQAHQAQVQAQQARAQVQAQQARAQAQAQQARAQTHQVQSDSAPAAPLAQAAQGGQSVTLILPCPYTNQKMRLVLNLSLQRMDESHAGGTQLQLSAHATTAHPPAPDTIPVANARRSSHVYARPPIPIPMPMPSQTTTRQAPQTSQPPMPKITGLESLDELEPIEHVSQPRMPAPAPAPSPNRMTPARGTAMTPRSPSTGVPLPDVPVLHHQPMPSRPQSIPDNRNSAPVPSQDTAPMDLEAFEQQVGSSGAFSAHTQVESADTQQAQGEPEGADYDETAAAPAQFSGVSCSVFMGKTNSPKVHQLFADLTGVPLSEAQKTCLKPIVAIAKDITEDEAREIKTQFAAINVQVRITKKR